MVVFFHSGFIRAKVVVFVQCCFIRTKWLYKGKSCCIWANMLYSCIFIVFGQWFYSRKSCCIRAKVVVLRHSDFKLESGCILAKVFVFGQERLH